MPVAKFQLDDGRIARFEVPDGTTPEQAQELIQQHLSRPDKAIDLEAVGEQARAKHYAGLSGMDQFVAGAGQGVVNIARGVGERLGMVSPQEIDQINQRDKALSSSPYGKAGNIAGTVGAVLPLAFVPGANTLAGSTLIGAGIGGAQPTGTNDSVVRNMAEGAIGGLAGTLGGRAVGAGAGFLGGARDALTDAGQNRIVGRTLDRFGTGGTNPGPSLIPGVQRTLAETTLSPGIAQLQRTLTDPAATTALTMRELQNNAARIAALRGVGATDTERSLQAGVRSMMAGPLYEQAAREGIDTGMASTMRPAIESVMQRPATQAALKKVQEIFGNEGVAQAQSGSLRGLQMLKQAMDDTIERAGSPMSSIGKNQLSALQTARSDLISLMGDLAPTQRAADQAYAAWSRPLNAMDAGNALFNKATTASADALGNPTLYPEAYNRALRDSSSMVKGATGRAGELADLMSPSKMNVLENLGNDLSVKQAADKLGIAKGSNTAQNLASQNLLRQIAGPIGLPQSMMDAKGIPLLMRPLDFALKSQEPSIQAKLGQALLDPELAARLRALSVPDRNRIIQGLLDYTPRAIPAVTSGATMQLLEGAQ